MPTDAPSALGARTQEEDMSTGFIATVTIACVLLVVFMVLRLTVASGSASGGVAAMFAKTAASLGFIAIAIAGLYEGAEDFRAALFVLAGLVFGLIGDMMLDLKVVYLEKPEEGVYLTGGMVSFGVGHIMYLTAVCLFVGEFVTGALIGGCVAVAAVLACATVFGGAKLMKLDFGKFRIHSLLYAFILMFMSALSVGVCITMNSADMALFAAGMVLFLLSDIVLTQMYFGGKPRDKVLCTVNHTLYYAAQICIACFVFFM